VLRPGLIRLLVRGAALGAMLSVLWVFLGVLAVSPPAAAYVPWEQMGEGQKVQVRAFFRRLGPFGQIVPPNEGPVGEQPALRALQTLTNRQAGAATNPAQAQAYRELQSRTVQSLFRSGLTRGWASVGGAAVRTGAVAGTFSVAYAIGNGLNRKVFRIGLPDPIDFTTGPIVDLETIPVGPLQDDRTWQGPIAPNDYPPVPGPGWQYSWLEQGETQREYKFLHHYTPCDGPPQPPQDNPLGFGEEVLPSTSTGSYSCGLSEVPPFEPIVRPQWHHLVWEPLHVTHGLMPVGAPGAQTPDRDFSNPPANPTDPQLDTSLGDLLADPDIEPFDRWLQKQLWPQETRTNPTRSRASTSSTSRSTSTGTGATSLSTGIRGSTGREPWISSSAEIATRTAAKVSSGASDRTVL
jgi:hypothetical protein